MSVLIQQTPPATYLPTLWEFLELGDQHDPALPPLPERKLGLFGKLIDWIHTTNLKYSAPWIFKAAQKVVKMSFALFASIALLYSFYGAPIFILGFKEYIEQLNRAEHDQKFQALFEAAKSRCLARFLEGRLAPLNHVPMQIKEETLHKMARDIEGESRLMMYLYHKDPQVRIMTRQYLLRKAAVLHADYLSRYNIRISSKGVLPSMRRISIPPLIIETSPSAFPEVPQQITGTIGKGLKLVQEVANQSLVHEIAIQMIALVSSTFLLWSLVGIPLFLIGFYEYTCLREQTFYDREYKRLEKIAAEQGEQKFLEGRLAPLTNANVDLNWRIRRAIRNNFPMIEPKQDNLLLSTPAAEHPDFLQKYGLQLRVC